jgi:zinc protease
MNAPSRGSLRMKRPCLVLLLSCAALAAAATHALPAPAGAAESRSLTLKNGLRVLLVPDPRATAVDVSVWVQAGVRYERPGKLGISHLAEHLSSRGATPGGADELRRRIEAEGGTTAAYTTADFTCYTHTVPRAALAMVLRLEAGRFGLRPTQAMLDQERAVVREENRARARANPLERGLQRLYATAFATHPYRWPVLGSDDDLQRITLGECEDFLRTRYTPDQVFIAIVGDFDPDQASDELRRGFEPLRQRGESRTAAAEPEPNGERRAVEGGELQVPMVIVGWRVPTGATGDAPALDLISILLSRGPAARLNLRRVGGEQLSLFAQTGRDRRRDATMFWAAAAARSAGDTAAVERRLLSEIETLATEPVSGEELDRARRQLEVALLLGRQSARDRGQVLGTSQMNAGDWRDADRQLERLRSLTPADLQAAAARTLIAARRTVVWMSPGTAGATGEGDRP